MKLLKYSLKTTKTKIWNSRMGAFFLLLFLVTLRYNKPIREYANAVKYPCSIWVIPFLLAYYGYMVLFLFGVIYVNSDVPFLQYPNMYQMLRVGRKKWALSQMIAIFLRSFVIMLIVFICSVITLLPSLEFTFDWGRLLRSAAMTDAQNIYKFHYEVNYDAIVNFTPIELVSIVLLLGTLVLTLIGVIMFALGLLLNRIIAVAGATTMTILIFLVLNVHPMFGMKVAKFIPPIWLAVSQIYTPKYGYYWIPSLSYMFTALLVGIFGIGGLIIAKIHKAELDWIKEDT